MRLSERVESALALKPMTKTELARCLSTSYNMVAAIVDGSPRFRVVGREDAPFGRGPAKTGGKAAAVYALGISE